MKKWKIKFYRGPWLVGETEIEHKEVLYPFVEKVCKLSAFQIETKISMNFKLDE